MIAFDENGKLYINHYCDYCERFPLENLEEKCSGCGFSQLDIITTEQNVNRHNKALDYYRLMGNDDKDVEQRQATLHLTSCILGGDNFDQLVFTDIDETDEIRGLAQFTDQMCQVVIYPMNMRIREIDYNYDDIWEDED